MLERRIKDPRLGFVTVTDVRVTGDTQQATIFYTVLGGSERATLAGTAAALESAKGLIRSEVAKQLGMRHVPTLSSSPTRCPRPPGTSTRCWPRPGRPTRPWPPRPRRGVRRRDGPVQEAARGRRSTDDDDRRRRRRPSDALTLRAGRRRQARRA